MNRTPPNPLAWCAVDKGILISLLMIPPLLLYLLGAYLVVLTSADGAVFDLAGVQALLPYLWALTGVAALVALAGWYLRDNRPNSVVYQHLVAQLFAIGISFVAYCLGALSMVAGVVLAGVPLVLYTLFDQRVVVFGVLSAAMILVGSACASALDGLPYAPVVAAQQGAGPGSLIWVTAVVAVFALPYCIGLFVLLGEVIRRWRRREEEVAQLSIKDALTGVFNRRAILEELERELHRSEREDAPLSVLVADLDYFKDLNDSHGHRAGDGVLRSVAAILDQSTRLSDRVGRFGGGEFLIILPNTRFDDALVVAERCRTHLCNTPITVPGSYLYVSASFGVTSEQDWLDPIAAQALVQRADQGVSEAKDNGRNSISSV